MISRCLKSVGFELEKLFSDEEFHIKPLVWIKSPRKAWAKKTNKQKKVEQLWRRHLYGQVKERLDLKSSKTNKDD